MVGIELVVDWIVVEDFKLFVERQILKWLIVFEVRPEVTQPEVGRLTVNLVHIHQGIDVVVHLLLDHDGGLVLVTKVDVDNGSPTTSVIVQNVKERSDVL